MIDFKNLDLEKLAEDLVPVLHDGIKDLLEGTAEDIESFARAISMDLLQAQMLGDEQTQEQLMDQLVLLAEIQNIRVRNESWTLFSSVVGAIFKAVLTTAISAVL